MMKQVFFIGLLLATVHTYALSGKQFMQNVTANYDQLKSLDLELNYKLYKGFNGTDIQEEYASTYKRSGKESYRKIAQTELINTTDYLINVNHNERRIIISNPSGIEAIEGNLKQALKMCSDIRIVESNGIQKVDLIIKEKSDIPYSLVSIQVNEDFWIQDITFYYALQTNFSKNYFNPDMDYPKMVVTYGDLKQKWKDKEGLLKTDRFFVFINNKMTLTPTYQSYELIDLRR